jgi:hypothetical protein
VRLEDDICGERRGEADGHERIFLPVISEIMSRIPGWETIPDQRMRHHVVRAVATRGGEHLLALRYLMIMTINSLSLLSDPTHMTC